MQSKDVKAFKNRLRYYSFLEDEIKSIEKHIEELYDQLGGVRGVDPSKEPIHAMPNKEVEWMIREYISKLDANLSHKRREKDEIDRILARMETSVRTALIQVYVNGEHMIKVGLEMNLSPNGLAKRMNKAIKEALNDKNEE